MSAAVVGRSFPMSATLDDLAEMNGADRFGRRYELSPEGTLWVMPRPDSEHAGLVSELMCWLAFADWPPQRLLPAAGIRISEPDGEGGRIPDLLVCSKSPARAVWLPADDIALVVEVVSAGSEDMDKVIKPREYARAGIPRYWMVDRDPAQTVTLHGLGDGKSYDAVAKMPLAWLLQTTPADHGLSPQA